jgi:hypothetical protein
MYIFAAFRTHLKAEHHKGDLAAGLAAAWSRQQQQQQPGTSAVPHKSKNGLIPTDLK